MTYGGFYKSTLGRMLGDTTLGGTVVLTRALHVTSVPSFHGCEFHLQCEGVELL